MTFDLAMMCACFAVALGALAFKGGRDAWLRILLKMRFVYVETPLRLIAGRRRPDHARIEQLERELGWLAAEPDPDNAELGKRIERLRRDVSKITARPLPRVTGLGGISTAEFTQNWEAFQASFLAHARRAGCDLAPLEDCTCDRCGETHRRNH